MELFLYIAFSLAIILIYINFNIKNKQLILQINNKDQHLQSIKTFLQETQNELEDKKQDNLNQLEVNAALREEIASINSSIDSTIKTQVEKARADSVKRQRSILKGQAMEQLAPFIHPDYQVKDYKFMGDPIDYVIFSGMSEKKDEIKIIFMDIKTGTARLTKIQKQIKQAIEEGRFTFEVFRPDNYLEETQENDESD